MDPQPAASAARKDRVIRVFVSSTFRDMQEDRNWLVKHVFPQLRKRCEARGVTWGEVDLRWGVTEEEAAEGKVLPLCLEEIRHCRPYFIGLLGERYGWVLEPHEIPDDLLERETWVREHLHCSVTELEIIHGVLRDELMHRGAFFYFRDRGYLDGLPKGRDPADFRSESPEAQEKLDRLKQRIRAARDEEVCRLRENYHNPEELGHWILEDFTRLIDELYPEDQQPGKLDREAAVHEAFARNRTVRWVPTVNADGTQGHRKVGCYIGRQEYFNRLDARATTTAEPLVVLGESGSGKSALLANWAIPYGEKHPDDLVILHFIGASADSANWQAMLRRILGELKRRFDIPHEIPDGTDELRAAFANWLNMADVQAARANCRIVLVIDALNQLEDREGALDLAWLPPAIPEKVRLVLSTLPGRPLDELTKRGWPTLEVKPLEIEERRQLIADCLAQYTKALSPHFAARIAEAPQTANPLYLRALLEELRLYGEHFMLGERIEHYLAAKTVDVLYEKILERYEEDYESRRPGLVRDAMSLIWASRRGLAEAELMDLLGTGGGPVVGYWA